LRAYSSYKEILNIINNYDSVGLVPTMGSLHMGHLSLIERAQIENKKVIISIYVNPTQFNDKDDFKKYPRNIKSDIEILKKFKNILVYTPNSKDIYKNKESSNQYDFGEFMKIMEGKNRPGHFDGVATIIEKLFNIFKPTNAYFGEKDFQQLMLIRMLTEKLKLKIKIIGCKTIRESDGLAMSSRNTLMNKEERKTAVQIYKLLKKAEAMFSELNPEKIKKEIQKKAQMIKNLELEYFEIINLSKYFKSHIEKDEVRAFIACKFGKIRLIDNLNLLKN